MSVLLLKRRQLFFIYDSRGVQINRDVGFYIWNGGKTRLEYYAADQCDYKNIYYLSFYQLLLVYSHSSRYMVTNGDNETCLDTPI